MNRYNWDKLTHLQLGRYAEYYMKMEFTQFGFEVYSPEVDERGIDFLVRKSDGIYYEVQVKSAQNYNYIFLPKRKFKIRENLLVAVVLFVEEEPPKLYLIRSTEWLNPNLVLVDRSYEERKSEPEFGINLSKKNMPLMDKFQFDKIIRGL